MRHVTALTRAAHPRQALVTAAGLTLGAALAGRSHVLSLVLLFLGVLLGQAIQGWHNDVVDEARDRARSQSGKPVADGSLPSGDVWFAIIVAALAVVPLSIAAGKAAGVCYLAAVLVGCLANLALRRSVLSFVPWAVQFALYAFVVTEGGWAGIGSGEAPRPLIVVLMALLGVGVHLVLSARGLVADHEDGWKNLPLRLALRLGANRLMIVAAAYTLVVLVVLLVSAQGGGWQS